MNNTRKFSVEEFLEQGDQKDILLYVYNALEEKGYNPVNQLVGYLITGIRPISQLSMTLVL